MNSIFDTSKCASTRAAPTINLAENETFSLQGRRGTTLRCVAGVVWVTREGDWRDYVLPQGVSFVAADAGRIVINGLTRHNRVVVSRTTVASGEARPHRTLRYGAAFFSQMQAQARAARSAYVAALLRSLGRALTRAWQRALQATVQRLKTQP